MSNGLAGLPIMVLCLFWLLTFGAVFWTASLLRVLTYGRRRVYYRWQILFVRVPAIFVLAFWTKLIAAALLDRTR
jgi:hypothetical protein